MTDKKRKEYYDVYKAAVIKELGLTEEIYKEVKKAGTRLNQLYVNDCNGEYEGNEEELEEVCDMYYEIVARAIKGLGLEVFYQGDPRGATIYLSKEPMDQSNYNKGYCIY